MAYLKLNHKKLKKRKTKEKIIVNQIPINLDKP